MDFASLFTGIGGFDRGLELAGHRCVLQVEQDKYCLDVLNRHWRDVPKIEDVKNVKKVDADAIVGGFPCQGISQAGLRKGLADPRSNLWWEFYRIIEINRPRLILIENVRGLLSCNNGQDMLEILRALDAIGYDAEWRCLDSQFFGIPQRRRRIFIAGYIRGPCRSEILFERESGAGDFQQSREKGKNPARKSGKRPVANNRQCEMFGYENVNTDRVITYSTPAIGDVREDHVASAVRAFTGGTGETRNPAYIADTLQARDYKGTSGFHPESNVIISETNGNILHEGFNIQTNDGGKHRRNDRPNGGMYVNPTDTSLTVGSTDHTVIQETTGTLPAHPPDRMQDAETGNLIQSVSHTVTAKWAKQSGGYGGSNETDNCIITDVKTYSTPGLGDVKEDTVSSTLMACKLAGVGNEQQVPAFISEVKPKALVRRLTPVECCRLQGFPDDWNAHGKNEPISDAQRYKQLGNAVSVPVAKYLGELIAESEIDNA